MHGSHVGRGTPNNGHVWDETFSLKLKPCLRKVFLLCLVHKQDSLIFFPRSIVFWLGWVVSFSTGSSGSNHDPNLHSELANGQLLSSMSRFVVSLTLRLSKLGVRETSIRAF